MIGGAHRRNLASYRALAIGGGRRSKSILDRSFQKEYRPPRGQDCPMARHKEFNRDEALQKAMEVFWRHGYPGIQWRRIGFRSRVKKVELRKVAGRMKTLRRSASGGNFVDIHEPPSRPAPKCGAKSREWTEPATNGIRNESSFGVFHHA